MMHLALFLAIVAIFQASPVFTFWIFSHSPLGLDARLDPIVFPGTVSPHSHTFVGENAVGASQTNVTIQAASCTTGHVQADKSSYWSPTLFKYSNGAFAARTLGLVQTYYLQRGNMPLQAFPPGLKMVAGNAMAVGPQSTPQLQRVVSFVCLNYANGSPQTTTLPAGPCPQGLRAQIIFPSCWDGKNLDSPNHASHMAYPLGDFPDNGDACPSTHPIRFITLFYEFIWNVGSQPNNGSWIFANGDSIGWSFHADFQNGWDTNVLQSAINQCTGQLFGDLESCPPFVPTLDRSKASSCKVDPSTVTGLSSEQVDGKIAKLPGCNPVQNRPNAGAGNCGNNPTISPPTGDGYKGCYAEPTNGNRALPRRANVAPNTPASCRAACSQLGMSIAGLEYSSECWCGNSFAAGTVSMLDSDCNMKCTGSPTQTCGDADRLSVYSSLAKLPVSAPPTMPATISTNFKALGCYKDSVNSRSLPIRATGDSLESCAAACSNYKFFGTEYSNECYCGNTITAPKIDDLKCNMVCAATPGQLCGGPDALSIYNNTLVNTVAAPVINLLAGTRSLGCFADSLDRSLTFNAFSNSSNTPSTCASACRAAGYKYSGTQYSSECFCGNDLLNQAASGPISDGCNMPCSGSAS